MAYLVIDASIAAAWCFPDERIGYANAVLRALSTSVEALAPRLWAYELRNSVLTGMRRKRITAADAEEFLGAIGGLPTASLDSALCEAAGRAGVSLFQP